MLQLVRERVNCLRCGGGFLLDGFPRTVAQAEALQALLEEQHLALDAVLSFELPMNEIVARLARTAHLQRVQGRVPCDTGLRRRRKAFAISAADPRAT